MPPPPTISVVMSVHNGGPFLREAVESILGQTYADFEFIVVDDASTDATPQVLDAYSDPRLIRLTNKQNLGLTASLNTALHVARAVYVARMDADDVSELTRFQTQLTFLREHPEVGVAGTCATFIDASGAVLWQSSPPDNDLLPWMMMWGNPLFHSSVMMRRSAVLDVGGYDPACHRAQDFELWCRLLAAGRRLVVLPILGVRLRRSPQQVSVTQSTQQWASAKLTTQRYLAWLLGCLPPAQQFEAFWAFAGHSGGGVTRRDFGAASCLVEAALAAVRQKTDDALGRRVRHAFGQEILAHACRWNERAPSVAVLATMRAVRLATNLLLARSTWCQMARATAHWLGLIPRFGASAGTPNVQP